MLFLDLRISPEALKLIAITLLIAYWLLWVVYARLAHPMRDIRGPFWASISRIWYAYHMSKGDIEATFMKMHDKYGQIVRIAPDEVSISDPHAIRIIYAINSGFYKTDFYLPFRGEISKYPDHFTVIDEKLHAARRKIVNSIFAASSVLKSEKYIDNCGRSFVESMHKYAETEEVIDIGDWLQWYTFDIVGELLFGRPFGFMREQKDVGGYVEALDSLLPVGAVTAVLPAFCRAIVPLFGVFSSKLRFALSAREKLVVAAKECVAERQRQIHNGEDTRQDMLAELFRIKEEKGEKEDFGILDVEETAFGAIFAGSDTTAIALRSILYHLIRTPLVLTKLQQELDQAASEGYLSSPAQYAEATRLPYLKACIKEGMRIHPSLAISLPRHVPQGGREITGRYFPEGSKIGINAWVIQRDEEIFGKDARVYNPERWFDRDAEFMDRYMFQFGGGSRTCIGKNVSLIEIHKLIPTLLREFDFEIMPENQEWQIRNFMMSKQIGFKVRVKRRSRTAVFQNSRDLVG